MHDRAADPAVNSCEQSSGQPENAPANEPVHTQALAVGLTILAGAIRLVPHPWNFTPVAALGLFGGARLRPWQALGLPLSMMVLTDLALWKLRHDAPFNPYVYGCFAVTVVLGLLLRRTRSRLCIGGAALGAAVLFFLVTNFGVWLAERQDPSTLPPGVGYVWETEHAQYPGGSPRYANNPRGLLACYLLGLNFSMKDAPPFGFTGNMLAGDLFFTGLLFAVHGWFTRRQERRATRPAVLGQAAPRPTRS